MPSEDLIESYHSSLLSGSNYARITEARKEAEAVLGRDIPAGHADAKVVDEAMEKAVVRTAQDLLKGNTENDILPPETTHDAFDRLTDLLDRQPRLSVRTSTSVAQQAYSTPIPIAYLASRLAGVTPDTLVYEPTAGNGALIADANPALVIANELNGDRFSELATRNFRQLTQHDASEYSPGEKIADVVVTNPPFGGVKGADSRSKRFTIGDTWSSQIDHAISLKALEAMKDEGRAVLILGGQPTKGSKDPEEFRAKQYNERETRGFYLTLYRQYNVVDHFSIDGKLYEKQGAGFPIDLIVIDGRRQDQQAPFTRKLPAADVPKTYTSFDDLKKKLPNELIQPISQPLDASLLSEPVRSEISGPTNSTGRENLLRPDAETPELDDRNLDDGRKSSISSADADSLRNAHRPSAVPPSASRRPGGRVSDDRLARGLGGSDYPTQRHIQGASETGSNGQGIFSSSADRPGIARLSGASRTTRESQPERMAHLSKLTPQGGHSMADEQTTQDATQAKQVPYEPRSRGRSMDTLIPRNMASAAQGALDQFERQHGDIDEYVRERLGYGSTDELQSRLYAEQIDNIALAISNHEQGNGFIIGDQTGIGKGCQCASMIRYGMRQDKPVIFMTKGDSLYKDMMRDLDTIAVHDFKPFITDSDIKIPLDSDRELRTGKAAEQKSSMRQIMHSGMGEYNAIFTTYSQVQTVNQKEPFRREFLRAIADQGALLILDESHEAGGGQKSDKPGQVQNRAEFVRELIDRSMENGGGAVYSSATYVKRPDVMDLYARSTDLRLVASNTGSLESTIKKGGVPLQQMIASKLVKSGQMMRRERSFDGVSFESKIVPADKETADQFADAMRSIRDFDRVKTKQVNKLSKELRAEAKTMTGDNAIGAAGVKSTNFTSLMHNCIDQGLFSQKAEATVQTSLEIIQSGRKPVIAVDNTMESFISMWVDTNGAQPGDEVDITFSDLLERYLERSRDIRTSNYRGEQSRRPMTDGELGEEGVWAYENALTIIQESDLSKIPISPIDHIKNRLQQEGYQVAEVTGRTAALEYSPDGSAAYSPRPGKNITTEGKIEAVNKFNKGEADVIIINRSGSTGISLHASEGFADQRPRTMLVAQASKDINVFMQTLGRIHRTGQVELPNYTLLSSDLPSEKRIGAILSDKMATLNANVTADRETAVSVQGVVDFMNPYGEDVVESLLEDLPDLNAQLDNPLSKYGNSPEDLALVRRVTGNIPLLPIEEQEKVYGLIEAEYLDYVAQKEAMGESLLEAGQLDLDAKTKARMEVVPDDGVQSEFSGPVFLEIVDAKSQSKPLSQLQVANLVRSSLDMTPVKDIEDHDWGKVLGQGQQRSGSLIGGLKEATNQHRLTKLAELESKRSLRDGPAQDGESKKISPTDKLVEKLNDRLQNQFALVGKALQDYPIGSSVRILKQTGKNATDVYYGVVTQVENKQRPGSPSTPSSWRLKVAISDGEVKSLTIPVSTINSSRKGGLIVQSVQKDIWSDKSVYELFDNKHEARHERQIFTGNLIKAFEKFPGKLVNFSDHKGRTRQGLLMSKSFDMAERLQKEPVVFKDTHQVKAFLTELTDKKGSVQTLDQNLTVRAHPKSGKNSFFLETPKAKSVGGKYFLDEELRSRAGGDFVSKGESMRIEIPAERIENTLIYLMQDKPLACFEERYLPLAREYMGIQLPEFELAKEGESLEIADFIDDNIAPYVEEPTQSDRDRLEQIFEAQPTTPSPSSDSEKPLDFQDIYAGVSNLLEKNNPDPQDISFFSEKWAEIKDNFSEEYAGLIDDRLYQLEATANRLEQPDQDHQSKIRMAEEWLVRQQGKLGPDPISNEGRTFYLENAAQRYELEPDVLTNGLSDDVRQYFTPETEPEVAEPLSVEPPTEQSRQTEVSDAASQSKLDDSPEIAPPSEQSRQVEQQVAQFLHEAGLAEAVMQDETFHTKIENPPFTPLVVESHDMGNHREIYLTHYLYTNDQFQEPYLDTEMVLEASKEGALTFKETATQDPVRGGEVRAPDRNFANVFAQNILDQGFAEAAQLNLEPIDSIPEASEVEDKTLEELFLQADQLTEGNGSSTVSSPETPSASAEQDVSPPQPEHKIESQPEDQQSLLTKLRAWYQQARAIGRSANHIAKIESVGKAVKAGDLSAYGSKDADARQNDEYAWYVQNANVVDKALFILDAAGTPNEQGGAYFEGQTYNLQSTRNTLTVQTEERGEILKVEGDLMVSSKITLADKQSFSQFSSLLEDVVEQEASQHHQSPVAMGGYEYG